MVLLPKPGCSPPSPPTPFLTSGSRRYSDRNDKNQAPSSGAEWPRFGTTSSAVLSPPTALSIGSKPSTVYQAQRAFFCPTPGFTRLSSTILGARKRKLSPKFCLWVSPGGLLACFGWELRLQCWRMCLCNKIYLPSN